DVPEADRQAAGPAVEFQRAHDEGRDREEDQYQVASDRATQPRGLFLPSTDGRRPAHDGGESATPCVWAGAAKEAGSGTARSAVYGEGECARGIAHISTAIQPRGF